MTHLDDKTALITSGGRAIALQLAQHGAHVAVAGVVVDPEEQAA